MGKMSLDVNLYKMCSPIDADIALDVNVHDLQSVQTRGIVLGKFVARIGKNCMSKKWHDTYESETTYEIVPFVFTKENIGVIYDWLSNDLDSDSYFKEPDKFSDWDFIHISW